MLRRLELVLTVSACALTYPMAARADYADVGPEATTTTDLPIAGTGGATGGSLVVPNGAGPYPLLVTSHGFSATSDQQVGWAEHFASYGFVVAVPSFPNTFSPDETVDSAIIQALVATYSSPPASSPAFGKVDGARFGIEGHSAGGLATTMASLALSPRATVLFDPVDNGGVGIGDVPKLCSPLLEIFSDASSCNNNAAWDGAHVASLGDLIQFHVVGSTHCDGENHARSICAGACGGAATTDRQNEFARYATAFFLAYVKDDAAAKASLAESMLTSDPKISGPSVASGTSCGVSSTGPDGGVVVPGDGGPSPSSDAGPGSSTSGASGGGDSPTSSGGCACSSESDRSDRESAWICGVLAIATASARRRARRAST